MAKEWLSPRRRPPRRRGGIEVGLGAFKTDLDSSAKNISFCMAIGTSSGSENSGRRKWKSMTVQWIELP